MKQKFASEQRINWQLNHEQKQQTGFQAAEPTLSFQRRRCSASCRSPITATPYIHTHPTPHLSTQRIIYTVFQKSNVHDFANISPSDRISKHAFTHFCSGHCGAGLLANTYVLFCSSTILDTRLTHMPVVKCRVRTDLGTDSGLHPVHCISTRCRCTFVDRHCWFNSTGS